MPVLIRNLDGRRCKQVNGKLRQPCCVNCPEGSTQANRYVLTFSGITICHECVWFTSPDYTVKVEGADTFAGTWTLPRGGIGFECCYWKLRTAIPAGITATKYSDFACETVVATASVMLITMQVQNDPLPVAVNVQLLTDSDIVIASLFSAIESMDATTCIPASMDNYNTGACSDRIFTTGGSVAITPV